MSYNNDYLLKYFFILGVPDEVRDELKINTIKEENTISPVLLSSYSAEGKTELFECLKNLLNNDSYLKDNIFPKKANFLSDLVFYNDPLEPPTLELKSNPFNQYINNESSFDQRPEHFSHCFQYIFKLDENSEDNIILNFSVLVFFENATTERDLLEEQKYFESSFFGSIFGKSKYYHNFIGKAIILVSESPVFSLMKEILEKIYKDYIDKKHSYFPIEQIIINCLEKINIDNDYDDEENIDEKQKFRLNKEPILPYCDLNISFFIKIFGLKDIFLIAEYYLCSKNIIIVCSNVEYLFPIYYIFMTLFFPLNKTSNERFYKLLVPDEQNLQRTIFGMVPTFQFIYNDEELDSDLLEKVCIIKEDILIYQITKNIKEEKKHEFGVSKKIMRYDSNKNQITKIDVTKYMTIIEKVLNINVEIYNDLKSFLINDIQDIREYFDNIKKTPTFFDSSFDSSHYDLLRNHFIGLFIKFFVTCLNQIQFNLIDNKIEIDIINFKKFNIDSSANELLSTLYTTPQSDLIYKNEIIKNGKFDNRFLKKIILLDYFLKISSLDENRSYFEPKFSKEAKNKENKLELKSYLKEIFDYKNILYDEKNIFYYFNRLYLYPLQRSKKVDYIIDEAKNLIEHLENYQELSKKYKSKDIENIIKYYSLHYMVFFDENFNLHFGQFVHKNMKIIYNNKNDIHKSDNINYSRLDFLENNETYEKYYKSTLDEAEIFYDLFITQIIVSENRMQLASCAIGLFISIYIIYLLSQISNSDPNNKKILDIIYKYQEKLFELFKKTDGYYGKYDFLITLLFEIVSSKYNNNKYTDLLIQKLEDQKILPSIIIILMYNHKISLNFRTIKLYIEQSNRINKNINKLEQRANLNFLGNNEENTKIKKLKTILIEKFEKVHTIEEISIYNIEREKHEHNYNIMDGINDDYNCENKNCPIILNFSIQKNKDDNKDICLLLNPRYIIIKLLKKILENNSLFIYPYEDELNEDINQIAMLDELYFQIGFFKVQQ